MDWRQFYADEAASAAGQELVRAAVARWRDGDPAVTSALRGGGVASFPHTTLRDSADPIARVAASIVAAGFSHVVALGVLHGGTLPEAERELLAELQRGGPRAEAAFERLGGAFVDQGPALGPWVRHDAALLADEFSLDLFGVVLAEAARLRDVPPPRVTRIFVGPTRGPDGSFAAGADVARAVRPLLGAGVACVATGDLVHFGHGYASGPEIAALPHDLAALDRHFAGRVAAMLDTAFVDGDLAAAYGMSTCELRSDQRNLLPVLLELIGSGGRADLLSFRLTDYAHILGEPPPCVVATALVVLRRGGTAAP